MERLTEKTTRSLMEAYAAVYDQDLRNKIKEEKKAEEELIENFVEFIDALLEEGYDLSNCKYEDLCDAYISCLNEEYVLEEGVESVVGGFLKKEAGRILSKYGPRVASGLYQGTKGAVKSVLKGVRDVGGEHLRQAGKGIKDLGMMLAPVTRVVAPVGALAGAGAAGYRYARGNMPSLPTFAKPKPSQTSNSSETPTERARRQRNELKVVGGGSGGYVSKMEPSSPKYKESQSLADKLTVQQLRQQNRSKTSSSSTQSQQAPQSPQLEIDPTTGQIKMR